MLGRSLTRTNTGLGVGGVPSEKGKIPPIEFGTAPGLVVTVIGPVGSPSRVKVVALPAGPPAGSAATGRAKSPTCMTYWQSPTPARAESLMVRVYIPDSGACIEKTGLPRPKIVAETDLITVPDGSQTVTSGS